MFAIDDPANPGTPKTFSIETTADVSETIKTIYNKVTTGTEADGTSILYLNMEDSLLFRDLFDITLDGIDFITTKSFFFTERHANLGDLNLRIISQGDCIIRNDQIQTNLNLQNHIYRAESQIDASRFEGYRYSNQGTTTDVAVALASCIDSNESRFSAHNIGSTVYIVSKISGYELMQSCLLLGKGNVNEFLTIENADLNILLSWLYFVVLQSSKSQATFGMRVCGIKIYDEQLKRASFLRLTGRLYSCGLSALILFIGV